MQVNSFGEPSVGYSFFDESGIMQGSSPFNSEMSRIMQFTGLLDSKGKKIWEGDIVKNEWRSKSYAVSFFNGAFRGHWDDVEPQNYSSTGWVFDKFEADGCEVIGNIYENP